MKILKLFFLSLLLSCSNHSIKKQMQIEEKQTEEKEYNSPSSSPGPYPGVDPTATAIAKMQ